MCYNEFIKRREKVMRNRKVRFITTTAVMLALLVALQALTKPAGQLLTGSCVNAVLAVSGLIGGLGCGLVVALVSPILAYLLGIAPQILTVPAIMLGNSVYVLLLWLLTGMNEKNMNIVMQVLALVYAAAAKFVLLYVLVAKVICGVLASSLLEAGLLKQPMLKALPATFSWPQLFTALIGGAVALLIVPVVKKALKK